MKLSNPVRFLVLCILLGCLVALLIPAGHCVGGCGGSKRPRVATCANNLRQLYILATVYASQHKGQWPGIDGEDSWVCLTKGAPPLIDSDHTDILSCPVLGEDCEPGRTHYRGPRVPFSKLQPTDPIAADQEGNHGDGETINVLLKNGMLVEVGPADPLWKKCRDLLRP